jgi:hypothetical protein
MNRKLLTGVSVLVWLATMTWPSLSGAQLLGSMATASVEEVGARKVGGYVGVTGDYVSLTSQFRYGVASSFDLGAKAAFVDFSSGRGSSMALNADARVQILDVFLQDPIDLALGPEVTYFRVNDVTNWYFGGFVSISKEFTLDNGRPLTPYGRIGVRLHRVETDVRDDDDVETGVAGGVEYGLAGYTSVYGELVIEKAGTGLYAGVQYQLP